MDFRTGVESPVLILIASPFIAESKRLKEGPIACGKMTIQRIAFAVIIFVLVLATCLPSAFSQPLYKFNAGYAGVDVPQLPIWFAREAGIFKRNGLDVQLISFTGGPTAIAALISGDVPITQVSALGVIRSN